MIPGSHSGQDDQPGPAGRVVGAATELSLGGFVDDRHGKDMRGVHE